jgi:hypothetical protein
MVVITVACAMWPPPVSAAGAEGPPRPAPLREHAAAQPIRDSLRTLQFGALDAPRSTGSSAQPTAPVRSRSLTRKVVGAAIGATGGFFAGGYLGAAIEGDRCNCDDPGLKGALIGAPIGAVTGGILGAMFF